MPHRQNINVIALAMAGLVLSLISGASGTLLAAPPNSVAAKPVPKPSWIEGELRKEMARGGFTFGSPAHLRIFKQENVLEIWLQKDGRYQRFKGLKICKWSGTLGPKLMEGDKQSPEGVYTVTRGQLLARTKNHRAINLDFPNALDHRLDRTGSALQIHGGCGSIGCYAMTDRGIEEIYRVLEAAFDNGQKRVAVHVFPFHMTESALRARKDHASLPFWSMLQPVYASFQKSRRVEEVRVCGTRYVAPGETARPPEDCMPVWKVPGREFRTASTANKRRRKTALPPVTVRCNLNRPSCKKWLAKERRKLALKGIKTRGVRKVGPFATGRRAFRSSAGRTAFNSARERHRRALRN
ncbi:MAG: L,D-transpeptidase family protein [Hyphomicrobiaceae bacterium]